MAFIDELTIKAKAGDGGNGVVRFRHEKGKEFGGPAGGNGGNGGDVYVVAVRDIHLLAKYRTKKEFIAERGIDGGSNSLYGRNGQDLEIPLPIGSIITNTETGDKITLNTEGEKKLLLYGGRGGRGNESFKSSTNQAPKEFTHGKPGQEGTFYIELELIADVGLIGLPNAGKTSLLNSLTNAKGKVGDYQFTTLDPNLGECFGYIISDIPGLIEGASGGKGLGHKFLRHVRRTKMLVHLISLESEDITSTYQTIRNELKQFDPSLIEKDEILLLTKTDVIEDEKLLESKIKEAKKLNSKVTTISLLDDESIKDFRDFLIMELTKD